MNKQYVTKIVGNEIDDLTTATKGTRNERLNKTAYKLGTFLHTGHISRNEIEGKLIDVGQKIGLNKKEAYNTIKSGLDAGESNPKTNISSKNTHEYISEEPLPLTIEAPSENTFPVTSLGKTLQEAAEYLHDTIQAPLSICCQSVLAAANVAVQGHANISLPTDTVKPISCYFISIASSGERKTAVDGKALKVIYEKQDELIKKHIQQNKEFDNYNEQKQLIIRDSSTNKEQKQKLIEELGEEPTPPIYPLIICSEPTLQGLIKVLSKGQPSMGLFSDEGGSFVGGYSLSKENRTKSGADLSRLWDANTVQQVRSGDGVIVVRGKRIALHLMLQPEMAKTLLSDDILKDQGLFGRFLVSFPDGKSGSRFYREISEYDKNKIDTYHNRLKKILDIPFTVEDDDEINVLALEAMELTPEAKKLFIEFSDCIEKDLKEGGKYFFIKSLANKTAEYAVRLAGTITLFEELKEENLENELPMITDEYMNMGINLCKYYLKEALRMGNIIPQDLYLEKARRLFDWLSNKWTEDNISISDIVHCGANEFRKKEIVEPLLRKLEEYGYLVFNEKPISIKGKNRKKSWRIKKEAVAIVATPATG